MQVYKVNDTFKEIWGSWCLSFIRLTLLFFDTVYLHGFLVEYWLIYIHFQLGGKENVGGFQDC